jgi:hypothetical protein
MCSISPQLGPFMDASHPSLVSGKVAKDPATIFAENFSKYLRLYSQRCPSTRIILVSSVKDVLNSHFAYPQRAIEPFPLNLPQVSCLFSSLANCQHALIERGVITESRLFFNQRGEIWCLDRRCSMAYENGRVLQEGCQSN